MYNVKQFNDDVATVFDTFCNINLYSKVNSAI